MEPSDIDRGREALTLFHNFSVGYPDYSLTYNELVQAVGKKHPSIFLDGLGFAIRQIDMSERQVSEAMKALAIRAQGRIPNSQTTFFSALSQRATTLNATDWLVGSPEILFNSGKDVVTGFQSVGEAVLDTGKSFLVIGPLLIVAGVVYFGFLYSKKRLAV